MEHNTKDKILYSSFRFFLEKGYEATNIRDICSDVGIKASTLYFYYKSKQDLFFYIYDEIFDEYIDFIKNLEQLKQHNSFEEKLYALLLKKIDYYAENIAKIKFMFRYHTFPPEEIASIMREKYKFWISEENKITLSIIEDGIIPQSSKDKYITYYNHLENYLIYEMIITNIKISNDSLNKVWAIFWRSLTEEQL